MIPQVCDLECFYCIRPAERCRVWKDTSPTPLCWSCAMRLKFPFPENDDPPAVIDDLLICPGQKLARLDRGRAGGDCLCRECWQDYYHHDRDFDHPYMTVLCDGSVVKL